MVASLSDRRSGGAGLAGIAVIERGEAAARVVVLQRDALAVGGVDPGVLNELRNLGDIGEGNGGHDELRQEDQAEDDSVNKEQRTALAEGAEASHEGKDENEYTQNDNARGY